jgi:hypothetical protein
MFNPVTTLSTLSVTSPNQLELLLHRMHLRGDLNDSVIEAKAASLGKSGDDIVLTDLIELLEFSPTSDVIDLIVAKETAMREKAINLLASYDSPDDMSDEDLDIALDNAASGMLLHHVISESASGSPTIIVSDTERTRIENILGITAEPAYTY